MLGSYIFTDPKGEIYDDTAGYLKSNGYNVKVLNLVNPANSDGYNPLAHINSELDVDVIANTVVKGQKGESNADPYWDDMAELLLKSLIFYLLAKAPPEEQNLASCAELVRAASSNGNSSLLSDLMNDLPYDHPARMYYKSVELASDKTYSSILSSLQSKLGKFDSKEIAEVKSALALNQSQLAEMEEKQYIDLTYEDIAKVVETWTGIPLQRVTEDEAEKLMHLGDRIKCNVIGQDEAVSAISKAIRRSRSGFRSHFKPASFIFVGPTGVGKTEIARRLAKLVKAPFVNK